VNLPDQLKILHPQFRSELTPSRIIQIALWLLVLGLGIAQLVVSEDVFEDHVFNDDFRQNFFWVKALVEREFFKDDVIAQYQRDFSSVGMELLYWPALKLGLTPNEISKVLSAVFYGGFLLSIFALGRWLDRRRSGYFAPLLLIFVLLNNYYFQRFIMGGIARSTAFPLQVILAVFMLRRRFWWVLGTTAVCAFFHPQTFLVGLGALFLWVGWDSIRRIRMRRAWPRLAQRAMALLLVAGLLGGWLSYRSQRTVSKYGRAINAQEIAKAPEYLVGGRWYRERPIAFPLELLREVAEVHPYDDEDGFSFDLSYVTGAFEYITLIALFVWAIRRHRPALLRLAPFIILIISSLVCYAFAAAMLAKFYFPNRFIRPIVPVAALVAVAYVTNAAIRSLISRRDVALSLIWIVATGVLVSIPWRSENVTMYNIPVDGLRDVAKFLKKQPYDVVVAAYPQGDGDNLPLISNRAVYIGREVSHPLYIGYMKMTSERHYNVFRALFPTTLEDVLNLRADGVDYILMRKEMLDEDIADGRAPDYDQPYDHWLQARFNDIPPDQMMGVWNEMIERGLAFEDDDYLLIDLRKL